jgi:hypothetical protein
MLTNLNFHFFKQLISRFIASRYLFLAGFLILINSCKTDPHAIELSGFNPEIQIMRLDVDLFSINIDSVAQSVGDLKEKYGEFFSIFNFMIVRLGNPDASAYNEYLKSFLTDFDMYNLSQEVSRVFPDLEFLEKELNEAFSRYRYYFPGRVVPSVFTYIGGFNQSMVTTDTILGIGLDKYLGRDNVLYSKLQTAQYMRYNMHPSKISSDCMRAWAMTEFDYDDATDNLINQMIYHGRIMYFTDYMLPYQHDTLKTGFSPEQLAWCVSNESTMWTYLVERKLLFTTDMRTINKFVNDAPFTSEFTNESPGRAAVWLGWQIVKSYMTRNQDVTLEQLMEETDYQKIFNKARYRP